MAKPDKTMSAVKEKSIADTLFVTDLDGTLLGSDSRVSARSASMLNKAIAEGANFTVATARTPATVSTLMASVDLRIPVVVMTGSALWDAKSGEYLDTRFHHEEDVRKLLAIYRSYSLPTFIYTMSANKIHIYHIGPLSDAEREFIAERCHNPYKEFHIPESGESELPSRLDNVMLLFAIHPVEMARKAYSEISAVGKINSVFYPDLFNPQVAFIEAFPEDATKAKAIKRLCRLTGKDYVVAFGDNVNDIPMFEVADEGIAVANAVERLKEVAYKVIGPNTEDSVPEEILRRIEEEPSAQA